MRTTLSIDDDVFAHARASATRENISLGEAVSRLARRGIVAQGHPRQALGETRSRYALLPRRDETITPEHVRALLEQEGI